MIIVSYNLTGFDSVISKLKRIEKELPNLLDRAMVTEMNILMTESMKRTPVEFGTLRASHHVLGPKREGDEISVGIFVGGPAAPYAVFVHEDLEARHTVGQAKFLESTLRENARFIAGRISKRINLRSLV